MFQSQYIGAVLTEDDGWFTVKYCTSVDFPCALYLTNNYINFLFRSNASDHLNQSFILLMTTFATKSPWRPRFANCCAPVFRRSDAVDPRPAPLAGKNAPVELRLGVFFGGKRSALAVKSVAVWRPATGLTN